MVGAEIITQASLILEHRPPATQGQVGTDVEHILADVQLLLQVLVIAVVLPVEGYVGKGLQSARAILQRQVVVVVPMVVAPCLTGSHQAQSVALGLQRPNADDGVHLGIVSGTRRCNHIYALDVCRLQLFQVGHVAYLLIVDIDFGLALGQHLKLTIFGLNQRNHRQQVVGIADVVKQRVLHIYRHAAIDHLVLRNFTLHLDTFYHIGLGLQGNGADVAHADIPGNGLIADIRHIQGDALGFTGNHEVAIPVAHDTVDKPAVV